MLDRNYILMLLLNILFWLPSSLELSLGLHSRGSLSMGKIFDMLFYIPFVVALGFGFSQGKVVYWRVGLCGFVAAVIYGLLSIWDTNRSVEGGWYLYGSWTGLVATVFLLTFSTSILALIGGLVKDIMSRH